MSTILLIEPLPIIRRGISRILSSGDASRQIVEIDYLGPSQDPESTENVDLAIVSERNHHSVTDVLLWVTRHFNPASILVMFDASGGPPDLTSIPIIATCISNAVTPEIFEASVSLLLAGGTYDRLHHYVAQTDAPLNTTKPPVTEAIQPAAPLPSGETEAELLGLTPRQYEVLVLLSKGHPIKLISRAMGISVATAKAHAEAVYQRLDVNNRNAAVYKAVSRGATLGWSSNTTIETQARKYGQLPTPNSPQE